MPGWMPPNMDYLSMGLMPFYNQMMQQQTHHLTMQ
jgi:hypothetical protein